MRGLGSVGARYAGRTGAPPIPIIFYAASREWADKKRGCDQEIPRRDHRGRRDRQQRPRKRPSASISKFTRQPIDLVKMTPPNRSEPALKPVAARMVDRCVMSSQKMLQSKLEPNKLVLK